MADVAFDQKTLRKQVCSQKSANNECTLELGTHQLPDQNSDRVFAAAQTSLSFWTVSRRKRIFDVAVICFLSPLLLPLLFTIALAVLARSGMPVLFHQTRIGCDGRRFVIYKFRTMHRTRFSQPSPAFLRPPDEITSLGRILRRFKLDELPQMLNVLKGDMSLVGPRPRIPEQEFLHLACRPGLTGAATLAFAREESMLAQIPSELLQDFYRTRIIPTKHQIDSEYLEHATFFSDFAILLRTVKECIQAFAAPAPLQPEELSAGQLLPDATAARASD